METARGRPGGCRHAAAPDAAGNHQSLGASPRPDDRLPAPDGRQGTSSLRALSRRQDVRVTPADSRTRPSNDVMAAEIPVLFRATVRTAVVLAVLVGTAAAQ